MARGGWYKFEYLHNNKGDRMENTINYLRPLLESQTLTIVYHLPDDNNVFTPVETNPKEVDKNIKEFVEIWKKYPIETEALTEFYLSQSALKDLTNKFN